MGCGQVIGGDSWRVLESAVIVVGSKYSTSDAWLAATSPDIGVILIGTSSYWHPASETLARLSSHAVDVYRTDQLGTIVIETDGIGWTLSYAG